MTLTTLDFAVFFAFYGFVVAVSLYKSRNEKTGEDFFLAGRQLLWPMIGFSLIASNISTEHFVGLAGQGARHVGFAIANYEFISVPSMIFMALVLLPFFLRSGICTMPEFLEYRYNSTTRALMATYTVFIYAFVTISAVIYSGGLTIQTVFGDPNNPKHLLYGILVVAAIATLYATWGGLKAVAWAQLFQGSALLLGGFVALFAALHAVGGLGKFYAYNSSKMHLILPASDPLLPWTALIVGFGLWIPCLYYWGLNQFITQRALASKSLKQGQYGMIFAAVLKSLMPLLIIIPGMIAAQLYQQHVFPAGSNPDQAYPLLVRYLLPAGLRGFMFAAIIDAAVSSLASMLNSASTIFTMDIFKRHWKKDASPRLIVLVGRIMTIVFVLIGVSIAPILGQQSFSGIFNYIQEFQGFVSPGVLAVFLFGLSVKRAPASTGVVAMALSPVIYAITMVFFGDIPFFLQHHITVVRIAFLNRMTISFVLIVLTMTVMTILSPMKKPVELPVQHEFDMKPAAGSIVFSGIVICALVVTYVLLW
ncbi:MAG: sodium/solute symporter [Terracidiphilus sp.]